jgi:hypothetical protein
MKEGKEGRGPVIGAPGPMAFYIPTGRESPGDEREPSSSE